MPTYRQPYPALCETLNMQTSWSIDSDKNIETFLYEHMDSNVFERNKCASLNDTVTPRTRAHNHRILFSSFSQTCKLLFMHLCKYKNIFNNMLIRIRHVLYNNCTIHSTTLYFNMSQNKDYCLLDRPLKCSIIRDQCCQTFIVLSKFTVNPNFGVKDETNTLHLCVSLQLYFKVMQVECPKNILIKSSSSDIQNILTMNNTPQTNGILATNNKINSRTLRADKQNKSDMSLYKYNISKYAPHYILYAKSKEPSHVKVGLQSSQAGVDQDNLILNKANKGSMAPNTKICANLRPLNHARTHHLQIFSQYLPIVLTEILLNKILTLLKWLENNVSIKRQQTSWGNCKYSL